MRSVLRLPSPSMAVAMTALVVSLGGTTFAATQLAANSVGPTQLKKNAVTRVKIAKSAVDGSKIANGSVTDLDLANGSITGAKIKAQTLTGVASANTAAVANGLAKVTYKTAAGSVPASTGAGSFPSSDATVQCDAGQSVLGGGANVESDNTQFVNDTHPVGTNGWTARVFNQDGVPHGFTVYAICAPVSAVG